MNWLNIKIHVLLVLLISCHSLVEAGHTDDEKIAHEQKLDLPDTDIKDKVHANGPPNFVDQIFNQPALRPSLAYHPGQSIHYNIGYNFGRTLGKSMDPFYKSFPALANFLSYWFSQAPFLGAPLDRHPDASKVVLVLANDTPETSSLPHADPETLKRLVRTPDFWEQLTSHMAALKEQMSQQVPAVSRTFGEGLNEFIYKTPILGDAQQSGAIDFANLGQTFGEKLLSPNLFSATGDSKSSDDSTPSPPSETERSENELTSNTGNPLLANPLFKGLHSLVPQGFPTPPPLGSMFKSAPAWPWMNQNQEAAASHISEVRVRPEAENTYKISPKEGITHKMAEMKLRAAMQDALDKKTIPILWFSMPANYDTSNSEKVPKTPSPMSEEDMKMHSKLAVFEKQLITELKQLQEVVKLANAMKKAQLEAKGMKYGVTDAISPLALTNTPIYKITLADIEKTLEDEYVRKLLQMIYSSQHKDMNKHTAHTENAGAKYSFDVMGNPSKRQTTPSSEAMKHINKEDMMKMMAYAYRMAAANGLEVPWQSDDNIKGTKGTSSSISTPQQPTQRQWFNSQTNMHDQQQEQMTMRANGEQQMQNNQWLEPKLQMQHLENTGTMEAQKQRQWLDANTQMPQKPFEQTMTPQRLDSNAQTNQQRMQHTIMEQAKQRQWFESNAQMNHQQFQQAMLQQAKQRQWLESNGQMNQQQQISQQSGESNGQFNMPQRQSLESDTRTSQKQQTEQRQWLENNGRPSQFQGQMPMQMRQMIPMNTNAQMPGNSEPNMQMRQWLESMNQQQIMGGQLSDKKVDTGMQQQRQMLPSRMDQNNKANEQPKNTMDMRQMIGPDGSNPTSFQIQPQNAGERQMPQSPQLQQQRQMNTDAEQNTPPQIAESTSGQRKNAVEETHSMGNEDDRKMMANHNSGMPTNSNEATPQMPENSGKERHKGLEDFFSDLNLFGHHDKKHKDKSKGTTINYYYNAGGSRYPPIYSAPGGYVAPPPSPNYGGYGSSYAQPNYGSYSKPSHKSGYYGSGGYGSNAYGSHGGYRTAVGDEEIEEMLRQHQTMPKMMLLIQPRDDNPELQTETSKTPTSSNSTPQQTKSSSSLAEPDGTAALKSLAKRPRHKSGGRSKRSAEFASLEPIDETSLNQLRKTYKNTLKEITLNPNETPEEALMRYNAESVREALAKANKEPMEISAGGDSQEVGEKVDDEEGYMMPLSTSSAQNVNHATSEQEVQHQYVPQQKSRYSSPTPVNSYASQPQYQEQQYQEISSLYPYQSKLMPQNPYSSSTQNARDTGSYAVEYTVSPYQLNSNSHQYAKTLNPSNINSYTTSYVKPVTYSPRSFTYTTETPNPVNTISKISHQPNSFGSSNYASNIYQMNVPQHQEHIGKSVHTKSNYRLHSDNALLKNVHSYERIHRQNEATVKDIDRSDGVGNLYEAMRARLSECCNECKEKLLMDLTNTLKRQLQKLPKAKSKNGKISNKYSSPQLERSHESLEEKFGEWLSDMVQKGYDKQYLTKDHQKVYKNEDRIHLALDEGMGADEAMYGDNQSYKRHTTAPAITTEIANDPTSDADSHGDVDLMTTEPLNSIDQDKEEDSVSESQTEEIDVDNSDDSEKQIADNINDKLENISISDEGKDPPQPATLEPAESTTHSVYALRGKYKSRKNHATNTLTKIYGKRIAGYRNLKLLGNTKSLKKSKNLRNDVSKVITKKDVEKHKNLEEILDLLYELSKARKEMKKNSTETSESTTSTTTSTTTVKPESPELVEKKQTKRASITISEKPKRRKLKSSAKLRNSSKGVEIRFKDTTERRDERDQISLAPPASGTSELLTTPTSAASLALPLPSSSSSTSSSSSSSSASASTPLPASEDIENSDSSEMRSMFSFNPKILKPFMGLQKVERKDDPWHYKPYNLYQPIFTGGGTFESLLNRYRRQAASYPSHSSQYRHVLTPGMLDRLLRIKVDFEKNYPFLYKTMMGHLLGDKHTTLSITPPEIPDHVSYPNVELAAAEVQQFETLLEQLKNEKIHQQQSQEYQRQHTVTDPSTFNQQILAPLIKSYDDEKNFWHERKNVLADSKSFWHQLQESEDEMSSIRKRESFWSQLEAAEEREQQRNKYFSTGDNVDKLFKNDDDFN